MNRSPHPTNCESRLRRWLGRTPGEMVRAVQDDGSMLREKLFHMLQPAHFDDAWSVAKDQQGWHPLQRLQALFQVDQGYGWYSLATAIAAVVLILLSFVLLAPRSASGGPSTPVGGLIERVLVLVALAWHVVTGWRLFALTGFHQRKGSPRQQKLEPAQPSGGVRS